MYVGAQLSFMPQKRESYGFQAIGVCLQRMQAIVDTFAKGCMPATGKNELAKWPARSYKEPGVHMGMQLRTWVADDPCGTITFSATHHLREACNLPCVCLVRLYELRLMSCCHGCRQHSTHEHAHVSIVVSIVARQLSVDRLACALRSLRVSNHMVFTCVNPLLHILIG